MKTRDKIAREVLAQLCAAYPATFKMFERARRPLVIGIHKQLEDKFPQPGLARALGVYTGNVGYLFALREGAARIGLDGQPTEQVVTAAEVNVARDRLNIQLAALRERRKRRKQSLAAPPPPPVKRDGLASLRLAASKRKDAEGPHAP